MLKKISLLAAMLGVLIAGTVVLAKAPPPEIQNCYDCCVYYMGMGYSEAQAHNMCRPYFDDCP